MAPDTNGAAGTNERDASVEALVSLTEPEVEALRLAHEVVRVHMAHDHSFEVRDRAMAAIAKVLKAAERVS